MNGTHWQARLAEEAQRAGVPGAALGIVHDGQRTELAHGILSTDTKVHVTTDSVFQIGSLTKTWTATVAMQLVDEGRIGLDAPVVDALPELRLGDPEAARRITLRHLLSHTSGLDGDVFTDTGRGDDCLERYVGLLAEIGQTHAVGAAFSYCNSGYMIVGRLIERLTGLTWDEAIQERLIRPLELSRTVTLPEDALRFRLAVGHHTTDGVPNAVSTSRVPRSNAAAGGILSSVRDQLTFAQALLGGALVPSALVAEMQALQTPVGAAGPSWGLGLMRSEQNGALIVGHDGAGLGQAAYLRAMPAHGLTLVLLANATPVRVVPLLAALWGEACSSLADVEIEPLPTPPERRYPFDPARYVGVHQRTRLRTEIVDRDGDLTLRRIVLQPLAGLDQHEVEEWPLVAASEERFLAQPRGSSIWIPVDFGRFADGGAYLHYLMRANPKIA